MVDELNTCTDYRILVTESPLGEWVNGYLSLFPTSIPLYLYTSIPFAFTMPTISITDYRLLTTEYRLPNTGYSLPPPETRIRQDCANDTTGAQIKPELHPHSFLKYKKRSPYQLCCFKPEGE